MPTKILSYWIPIFFIFALLSSHTHPVYAYNIKESSKQKFIGVGGWFIGKDCPNMELYWESKEDRYVNIFFRNQSGAIFKLPEGIAIFSSNCKYYWYTNDYEQKKVKVFKTDTGKPIITITGEDPAWSADGESIYFFRTKESSRQLWELRVIDNKESLILSVQDFLPCYQQGDGVEWYPVIITRKGYILWAYWVKDPKTAEYSNSAKELTIDPKTKRIIKIEHKTWCSCSAFEKDK